MGMIHELNAVRTGYGFKSLVLPIGFSQVTICL